jgi:hypothetical protein
VKTFKEIKRAAEKGDRQRVAEIAGISVSLVKQVINRHREDYYNIQKIFSDLLENRERLMLREEKRRERKAARERKLQQAA